MRSPLSNTCSPLAELPPLSVRSSLEHGCVVPPFGRYLKGVSQCTEAQYCRAPGLTPRPFPCDSSAIAALDFGAGIASGRDLSNIGASLLLDCDFCAETMQPRTIRVLCTQPIRSSSVRSGYGVRARSPLRRRRRAPARARACMHAAAALPTSLNMHMRDSVNPSKCLNEECIL